MKKETQHVFLVGAKGLGSYGGYETFIDKLTAYHEHHDQIRYHVACKANGEGCMDEGKLCGVTNRKVDRKGRVVEFTYHGARCFKLRVPQVGAIQAIYYDLAALHACCKYIAKHRIKHPIVYIMACRIGPFAPYFYHRIHQLGGKVYLNPDGHEWMRAKWAPPVRKYWKFSEQMMVKYSDLVICDSVNIEKYIHKCYDGKGKGKANPETTYIAYGAETRQSTLSADDALLTDWYQKHGLRAGEYYLVVGRFVPENNYETMIREFMKSHSKKDFAIITNVNKRFLDELEQKLGFRKDPRIKFVGTVYHPELLMKIREQAYAYFHGHEVGGTNPSLLEALGSTKLNLLLNVGFNREVAEDAAVYWTKKPGDLASVIDEADQMTEQEREHYGEKAKERVRTAYSWEKITGQYEVGFMEGVK
jgi:rhamnosyltransferase